MHFSGDFDAAVRLGQNPVSSGVGLRKQTVQLQIAAASCRMFFSEPRFRCQILTVMEALDEGKPSNSIPTPPLEHLHTTPLWESML